MFRTEESGNVTIVIVSELDARNAEQAKTAFGEFVDSGALDLVIDLSALDFIDSAGLGALLTVLNAVGAAGGRLVLCGLSKRVRSIFELTRLHRVFGIFDSREEAVGSL